MTTLTAARQEASSFIARSVADPVRFAHHVLGHSTWWTQRRVLQGLDRPRAKVAVRACHASSKTFAAAELALWWLARWDDAKVITTAPTFKQVRTLLWGEIHNALRTCRIAFPEPNQTDLYITTNRFAVGITARDATAIQGYHGGHILLIVDEAPGVRPEIFEAVSGIEAGGDVRRLMLGNPTLRGGPFFDAFDPRSAWLRVVISAFNTPNVRPLMPTSLDVRGLDPGHDERLVDALTGLSASKLERMGPFPPLVSAQWILDRVQEWGLNSPVWDARVMGRFPRQAPDALVNTDYIEAHRHDEPDGDDLAALPLCVGVDPAGPGDNETVVVARRGPYVLGVHPFMDADPRGPVAKLLRDQYGGPRAVHVVNVDAPGEGRLIQRHLEDLRYRVNAVNVGIPPKGVNDRDTAKKREQFYNLRAQLHWSFRERAHAGDVRGLDDNTAISQLGSIRWDTDNRGRIVIEKKEAMRRRAMPSPDRAEATILAFAEVPRKSLAVAKVA